MLYNSKREWEKLVQETRRRVIVEDNGHAALRILLGEMKKLKNQDGVLFEAYKHELGEELLTEGWWDSIFGGGGSKKDAKKSEEEDSKGDEVDLGGATTVSTWGDLQMVLGSIQHAKELEKIKARGGKAGKAAKVLLNVIPGFSSAAEMVKFGKETMDSLQSVGGLKDKAKQFSTVMDAFKDVPDKKAEKGGGVMDTLKIDDGYQTITDDRLEDGFIKWFANHIADKDPDEKIPDEDINGYFEQYVEQKAGTDQETVKGAATDTKFTEIPIVKDKGPIKKSLGRIGNSLGGFFSGLFS